MVVSPSRHPRSSRLRPTPSFRAKRGISPPRPLQTADCRAQGKIGNIILEQHGDPAEALKEVQKALEVCPDLMAARVDRARALMKLDRQAEVVKDLEAAEKADAAETSTHFLLGRAYRALGKTAEAQAEMRVFSKLEESARVKTVERAKQLLKEKSKEP